MYEKEANKNKLLTKENASLKLEVYVLKRELNKSENKIDNEVKQAIKPYIEEINKLRNSLSKAYEEIDRLKSQINNKTEDNNSYVLDKLTNQINKNSSNSGIPTSKENKRSKTGVNTYNHRKKSNKKTGGQYGHKGSTLTKEKLETKINANNIPVKEIIHYIKGNSNQKDTIKYKIGMQINLYVEKHIFKHISKSNELLPKEYYSDVTYKNDFKAIITTLGNYYSLGYNKS